MSTFVSSDLHLNHLNIPVYCPEYRAGIGPVWLWNEDKKQNWPSWDNITAMNEVIIKNWNEDVSADDDVYIIGDVAMGLIEKAPALIRRLNGKKYLVAGNHDKALRKLISHDPSVADLFVWVKDYYEMYYLDHLICMSHYPMATWNKKTRGGIMLHGHGHGDPNGCTGWIKDVGVDTNALRPYALESIIKEMKKNPEGDYRHDSI